MKYVMSFLLLVFSCSFVFASPFLVADPQQDVTYYEVQRDVKDMTGTVISTVIEPSYPLVVTGGVQFHHDLFGLPIGQHSMRVIAVRVENREGGATYARSDPVPFVYELTSGPGPSGLKLLME